MQDENRAQWQGNDDVPRYAPSGGNASHQIGVLPALRQTGGGSAETTVLPCKR